MLLYFVLGLLNICLLYLIFTNYKRKTGIDLENKKDIVTDMIACFISGPFGTIALILLGVFLYGMWRKYYKKK